MKKTVVITGANSGIGKAGAIQFAEKGYQVVMACRNIETSVVYHWYLSYLCPAYGTIDMIEG